MIRLLGKRARLHIDVTKTSSLVPVLSKPLHIHNRSSCNITPWEIHLKPSFRRVPFIVHRLILAMSSPVFEAMFYGPMAEKADLTLPDDPPEAFVFLMGYIYKGNASLPNVDMAVMVYKLANKYQMSSLFSVCSEYLQSRVDLNNLALVYEMSFLYEDSELKQKCRKVVSESREILSSPGVGQLTVQCMEDLLQQELPVQSEVAVFEGLLQWGTLQSGNSSTSAKCPKGLRQEIETLLPHIRFLTMTLDDFVEHVMPSGVLTPEESNAIMMNIKRVLNITLPAICSPNRKTRLSYQISLGRGNNIGENPTMIKRGSKLIEEEPFAALDDLYGELAFPETFCLSHQQWPAGSILWAWMSSTYFQ
ncbi:BTB/POZ domain-containing protein 3-like isoform X2 [Macrobrachium nipponense]|uniref:BTB/POZ domain-containing protein 3-like isoform X2 n=1 Tax=Macrobrachium nipponense TaxID=159736 RepID=UPI0030C8164B